MFGYRLCLLLTITGVCHGRGGTGRQDVDDRAEERTYPSQIQGYYYTYYMKYFTASGLRYAATNQHSARTVTVCTNYEPYFLNGTYLGEFPCPMLEDPDEFTHCCGENGYEYCCKAMDALPIRVGIGFGAAVALGLIVGFIACIVVKVKRRKSNIRLKEISDAHMDKKGIPKYDDHKTKNFVAKQSIDGYQVLVVFKSKKFYQRFYEELRLKYVDISWRYDDTDLVTEGKISLDSENWVNLVLCDDFEGSPVMIVMREKPSVAWMETQFMEICAKIPDEKGLLCCCCTGNNRTHPSQDSIKGRKHQSQAPEGDKTNLTAASVHKPGTPSPRQNNNHTTERY